MRISVDIAVPEELARRIVVALLSDLQDRQGFSLDEVNAEVWEDWVNEWIHIIMFEEEIWDE